MGFWDAVASAGLYTNNLHLTPDNTLTPRYSILLARCSSWHLSKCQSTAVIMEICVGSSVAEWLACWTRRRRAGVQLAVAILSGNSLRQTAHTHRASVHQSAKLVAALLRVVRITAGLAESNGNLLPGLWQTSPAGWLPRTGIRSGTLRSVIKYGLCFLRYMLL